MAHDINNGADHTSRRKDGAPPAAKERIFVGPVPLDVLTFNEAVQCALRYIESKSVAPPARIVCPNAFLVALADSDKAYANIIRSCELVVADGLPLVWAASLLGTPLPEQIRGVDLMEAICAACAASGMTFYILGGLPGGAERAAEKLVQRNSGLRLAGIDCPPIGFEADPAANQRVRDKIVAAAPDFLIVALGSPKQEWWISENCRDLPVGAIHGVGAAIDTVAGLRRRPPQWMRSIGLEWLGRLIFEPRRLWRRYLFGNARFLAIVYRQWRNIRR